MLSLAWKTRRMVETIMAAFHLAMVALTLADVIGRRAIGQPIYGANDITEHLMALVQPTGLEGYRLIFAILLVFLVLGCVMDSMAIILIFVPLFAPIVVAEGFDLVWFGLIVIVVTEVALVTPPVGMNVFVRKARLPEVPVMRIFKGLVPFITVDGLRLGVPVAFPAITLWRGSTVGSRCGLPFHNREKAARANTAVIMSNPMKVRPDASFCPASAGVLCISPQGQGGRGDESSG